MRPLCTPCTLHGSHAHAPAHTTGTCVHQEPHASTFASSRRAHLTPANPSDAHGQRVGKAAACTQTTERCAVATATSAARPSEADAARCAATCTWSSRWENHHGIRDEDRSCPETCSQPQGARGASAVRATLPAWPGCWSCAWKHTRNLRVFLYVCRVVKIFPQNTRHSCSG